MSKNLIIGLSVGAVMFIFMLSVILWGFSVMNTEISLRVRYEAQNKKIETSFDKVWKTISQQYQIKGDYEQTFKEGLRALSSGREGGALFKSVSESNAQLGLSSDMYARMMNSIEGLRGEFQREQNTLVDIWREHKTYCLQPPRSMLIGGKVLPEPTMITSTRTKEAVKTGIDDDVDLKAKKTAEKP
jgi:hypothetical protein